MLKNPPDITVLPGGRKVRTDTRPYADEPAPETPKLTGAALDARGAELEIEGFSSMKADEKRAAISEAEGDSE